MKLSIVTTLYQSAPYIEEFYKRCTMVAKSLAGEDYEIIFVNDGSPDNSLNLAINLTHSDPHVSVIDLSKNFGHHKAMMTGLAAVQGEYIFLIDSDLEENPEWLAVFENRMQSENCDMVYGVQENRRGGLIERVTGWTFYRLFRLLTGIAQPDNIVTARLMTRQYVDALIAHREQEINIGGLFIITGFKQIPHIIKKGESSPTTYTLPKKINHLVNAITSFSNKPLVFVFYTGSLISLSAIIYIGYLITRFLLAETPPSGYTSIIASIWIFSGLIIFFMGILGIYISKIFTEVKSRPYTIIRKIYGRSKIKEEFKK